MELSQGLLEWLADSDPTLRWQVERDLLAEPEERWERTRSRIVSEGFGAHLLSLQDDDGQWAGGAYFPKGNDLRTCTHEDDGAGQPYTATTWSLNALREWGAPETALIGTVEKLAANSRWEYDESPYWGGEVDCCINAYTLSNGVWLGLKLPNLAQWFLEHQLDDGGWNCEWANGAVRSSFHSTLNSLKGILWYERAIGGDDRLSAARKRAEEYLLERKLIYSLSKGEAVGPWVNQFAYPFRWRYTVLRALDYLREAAQYDGVVPDPRAAEAIELVRTAPRIDGRWIQELRYPGQTWFDVDVPVGEPSKWLTFYATRVLKWWERGSINK